MAVHYPLTLINPAESNLESFYEEVIKISGEKKYSRLTKAERIRLRDSDSFNIWCQLQTVRRFEKAVLRLDRMEHNKRKRQ